ncbi:hypothetical protein AQJ66_23215 [Streptomyces bungoensis]|uniref:Uncharacterized protein n=1 Tax=Streptomyces bungoensis TaxID=285568 RepID=A0A101SXH0_9ACTN|nr:hypothetical protein AQJ66_23215 [Streptomyces bungoensis]
MGCPGPAVRKLAGPYEYPAGVSAASGISPESFRNSLREKRTAPAGMACEKRLTFAAEGAGRDTAEDDRPARHGAACTRAK